MRQAKAEIYMHFVWATHLRLPLITPEIERNVYRLLEAEASLLRCEVLAMGGMPDHVHMLLRLPTPGSASVAMQRIKGASARLINEQVTKDAHFQWQAGYGVFTVTPSHTKTVIAYINNQKRHHTENTTHERWEETDMEYPDDPGDA